MSVSLSKLSSKKGKGKRKTGIVLDIMGEFGMINVEIMILLCGRCPEAFRVVPKTVEIEKVVEKIVDRVIEVPQVVPLEGH